MKIPSSIILLASTLVALPFALAKPIYEDTQLDIECANKYCGTLQQGSLKCAADTHNADLINGNLENVDQEDMRQFVDCYCDDLAEIWQQCLTCYQNQTQADQETGDRQVVCTNRPGDINYDDSNNNSTKHNSTNNNSTKDDSPNDNGTEDDESETETKENIAKTLQLGKSMIAGMMVVAGWVIAAM